MNCPKCGSKNTEITGGSSTLKFNDDGSFYNENKTFYYCKDCGKSFED